MASRLIHYFLCIFFLSTYFHNCQINCLRRLSRKKLSIENDDIRSLLSSALDSNPSQVLERSDKKRDISRDDSDWLAEDNIDSKDASIYDDEVEEDDSGRDISESKRSSESDSSEDQDSEVYDDSDLHELPKDVSKRETKNEDDYNDDLNPDISSDEVPSENLKTGDNLSKIDNRRETSADEVNNDDLNFQKQIEDQIQLRIDSIKEDIKRDIERKQQVREIEANNAKYDELEFNNENEVDNSEVVEDKTLESSKRSISTNSNANNQLGKSFQSVRSKRSDIKEKNPQRSSKRSSRNSSRTVASNDNLDKTSVSRSVRSDIDKVAENEDLKKSAIVLPVKRRSVERKVTLVEKREVRGGKRKDRRSILIPEQGHAEVKDELPDDLTLDSNLRIARSHIAEDSPDKTLLASRSVRSVNHNDVETRFGRDIRDETENQEGNMQQSNFLFAPREKAECRTRRRRSRRRKKTKKHPRRDRQHRAIRESSMDDEEFEETRDKRAMSLNEDAALEYKESFGGFQSDTSGGLGRFKRIRRSPKIA